MIWTTIAGVVLVTIMAKALGPVVLGHRELPEDATTVIGLMAPALLAALVLVDLAGPGWTEFEPTMLAGFAAAGVVRLLRAPLPVAVLAGMLVVAALRSAL